MKNKFMCQQCGSCCRNIRRNSKETQSEVDERNRVGPLYHLISAQDMGLVFFSFEKEKIGEIAGKLGVKIDFEPSLVLIDDKRKKVLVLSYNMVQNDCPFLDNDNLCTIYDDRPLVCRTYPLAKRQSTENIDIKILDCPNASMKKEQITGSYRDLAKKLTDYFGYDIFTYAEVEDIMLNNCREIIKYLTTEKNNSYFRAIRKPLKYTRPKLGNFEFIDFHIFIKELSGFAKNKAIIKNISKEEFNNIRDSIKNEIT